MAHWGWGVRLGVLAVAGLLLGGCGTYNVTLPVAPSTAHPQQRYDLDVAVAIPETTRAIRHAPELSSICLGSFDINGEFGVALQDAVSDRMRQLFTRVSLAAGPASSGQTPLTFEATLDSIGYRFGCDASPGNYALVNAHVRALNATGAEVWHASLRQMKQNISDGALMDEPENGLGQAASAAMGALADQWVQEFANLPPQTVAGMVGTRVAASPTTQTISLGGAGQPPPQPAPAPAPATPDDRTMELAYWQSVKDSTNASDFDAYLQQYPAGTFAGLARARLQSLKAAQAAVTLPPAPNSAKPAALEVERRVALVVGNARYRNVPRLSNTVNDARLMAATLRKLGFELVGGGPLLDLDRDGFAKAVSTFGERLGGHSSVAVFYYAGHGIQLRGANYLVPVDANPAKPSDVDFQLIDAGAVLHQMEDSGAKLKVVMLDACRNNPFGGRGLRDAGGGLAQMEAPEGTMISYATQPGNVASDGAPGGDSPYTMALAKTMQQPNLEVLQMFNAVGVAVQGATNHAQQPWFSSSPISGDFYFAGRATE